MPPPATYRLPPRSGSAAEEKPGLFLFLSKGGHSDMLPLSSPREKTVAVGA